MEQQRSLIYTILVQWRAQYFRRLFETARVEVGGGKFDN